MEGKTLIFLCLSVSSLVAPFIILVMIDSDVTLGGSSYETFSLVWRDVFSPPIGIQFYQDQVKVGSMQNGCVRDSKDDHGNIFRLYVGKSLDTHIIIWFLLVKDASLIFQ